MATQQKADPTRGNFVAFWNYRKGDNEKLPTMQGRLSIPGNQQDRAFALWPSLTDKGDTVISGRLGLSANDQITKAADPTREGPDDPPIQVGTNPEKMLTINPGSLVLFTNKNKDAENPNRPDYWGYAHVGGGQPLMRISAWTRLDRGGNPMLTGSVQKDEPRKEPGRDEQEHEEFNFTDDRDNGPEPVQAPAKKKSRERDMSDRER